MRDNDARNIISASLAGEIRPLPGKNVLVAFFVGLLACSCPIASPAADGPTAPATKALSVAPRTALPAIADRDAFAIRGTVEDENGSPLPNITVAAVEGLGARPTS